MKSFIICLLSLYASMAYAQIPKQGTSLPQAIFYKMDGKVYSTAQIAKGKKSMLMFFDATCEHCQRVATVLSKRSKELSGVNLYLISQDEPRSINYYMTNFAKPLAAMKNVTVLQDRDHVFIPLFHPTQYPSLYLFDRNKKLVYFTNDEKKVPNFFKLVKQ